MRISGAVNFQTPCKLFHVHLFNIAKMKGWIIVLKLGFPTLHSENAKLFFKKCE